MMWLRRLIDRLVYEKDKQAPDTYLRGKFFISFQLIFTALNIITLPYYFDESNVQLTFELKLIYIVNVVIMASGFYIYPRFGYRVWFVNISSVLAASASFYSTYYFSGGIFSPDLVFAPAISLYPFLVANRLSGIVWMLIGVAQILSFYWAAEHNLYNFREIANSLSAGYSTGSILFSVLFAVVLVLLYENMMKSLLGLIRKGKHELEVKNREILDSINYAQKIQQSRLPSLASLEQHLPECFVLFKPKDIVSGDFYFFQRKDTTSVIAAADCTGHGVPGALMSMLGAEKLSEAVKSSQNVSAMLKKLNTDIKNALAQSGRSDAVKDGMDIALCAIADGQSYVTYAGANRPLYVIRSGEKTVQEYKPVKVSIAGYTDDEQDFVHHQVEMNKGDTLYLFTDGYSDQFGGAPKNKKLMTKRFRELLLSIQHLSMNMQKEFLSDFHEKWKGQNEQVDDILIIGMRF